MLLSSHLETGHYFNPHAQRIIEGQNFDIRRTLWTYSALVEQQREIVYDWRRTLLTDDGEWLVVKPLLALYGVWTLRGLKADERKASL